MTARATERATTYINSNSRKLNGMRRFSSYWVDHIDTRADAYYEEVSFAKKDLSGRRGCCLAATARTS